MDSIIQGTPEWFAARAGKVTASKISAVMAKGRSGAPSATRKTYLGQLVAERLSGLSAQSFSSSAMDWGTETEPQARACYELETGQKIDEEGFVDHPRIANAGASPDGLAGKDGLVEIKCPNTATHIATLQGATIKPEYIKQMQFQMACTGRIWCDFISFDPRLPLELRMHTTRVLRDPDAIIAIEAAVSELLAEVDATVAALQNQYCDAA